MKGILNINKPAGITSHDVVNKVRRILNEKKAGHMGTLDPQATGVLIVGIGKAARLFDFFLNKDKVYDAVFTFGYETDTFDSAGIITSQNGIIPSRDSLVAAARELTGKIMQMPPAYSAKSVGGVRAYKLARQGFGVELEPCAVEIYGITLTDCPGADSFSFRIHCSSGTYIRSICRDLAYKTGSLAAMTALDRVRCGSFKKENAVTLEELADLKERALTDINDALSAAVRVDLPDSEYENILLGRKIPAEILNESRITRPAEAGNSMELSDGRFTVYCKGELFGLGACREGLLKITAYLRD